MRKKWFLLILSLIGYQYGKESITFCSKCQNFLDVFKNCTSIKSHFLLHFYFTLCQKYFKNVKSFKVANQEIHSKHFIAVSFKHQFIQKMLDFIQKHTITYFCFYLAFEKQFFLKIATKIQSGSSCVQDSFLSSTF